MLITNVTRQKKMTDSQTSNSTIGKEDIARHNSSKSKLNLKGLPPTFILDFHLSTEELHSAENELCACGAPLTYDITEAGIVLGNIVKARRAELELKWRNVRLDEGDSRESGIKSETVVKGDQDAPVKKRRRLDEESNSQAVKVEAVSPTDSSIVGSQTEDDEDNPAKPLSQLSISHPEITPTIDISDSENSEGSLSSPFDPDSFVGRVKVVRLDWLYESLSKGKAQPLEAYIVYEARVLPPLDASVSALSVSSVPTAKLSNSEAEKSPYVKEGALQGIIERAQADAKPKFPRSQRRDRVRDAMKEDFAGRSFLHGGGSQSQSFTKPTKLIHQTTSEHDEGSSKSLPPMPDWVLQKTIYSCERATPIHSPNDDFIEQLEKIKFARELTGDDVGVRAYSTSIASIAAYPHVLSSMHEVLALPGCDQKIAQLFHEWQTSGGHIQAVADIEAHKELAVLRQFYGIWGVGPKTAREFYYDQGWRELDDIIENGWKSLKRDQQIGLKFYDEFQLKMPRSEVEAIAAIVTEHGRRIAGSELECIIVGGYRRGKDECGDVDLILSHRDEHQTLYLVEHVVKSLEDEGWITHNLSVHVTNSKRNQQPVPLAPLTRGHGFDTLDKALVVWQSQDWPTESADKAADPKAKNPNLHRRLDIIVSPWRTVGCAVSGWTSGTTFQRDLRRYARKVKGWKFDSSGVRERGSGKWVDLELWNNPETRAPTWEAAERRVFEGMGLVYREPWDRCTRG